MEPAACVNKQTKLSIEPWYSIETDLRLKKLIFKAFWQFGIKNLNKNQEFKENFNIQNWISSFGEMKFGFQKDGSARLGSSMSNHFLFSESKFEGNIKLATPLKQM